MPNAVRFAIVGTGHVARLFARDLPLAAGARLVAVVSREAATARAFADAHAAGARAHDSLDAMLRDADVDVVYLATPNHLHARQALAVLAAGKPVLVEKPFATSAAQAREIVDMARRSKLFCMEAMWMRFLPLVRRARELIAEGIVGDVVGLSADFSAPSDLTGPGNRFADPEVGSGALLDRGIYGLSFASLLLGQPTEVVGMATLTEAALDLRSSILMKFDGGATAVITASLTTQGANTAVVEGTRGTLLLHAPFYRPERLTVRRLAAPASGPLAPPRRPSLATRVKGHPLARRLLLPLRARLVRPAIDIVQPIAGTGYQHEVAEVVRCLQGGLTESPLAPLDESVRLMEAMDTLRERWQRGAGR